MAELTVKNPLACSNLEIGAFIAFVRAGGEVSAQGLNERIRGAAALAFAHIDGVLAGVAALKNPLASYLRRVSSSSGVSLPVAQFPYELGWVYVLPDARGKGLSLLLAQSALSAAGEAGVFSTSRTDNQPMHKSLAKLKFVPSGNTYTSGRGKHSLQLFIRRSAQQSSPADSPAASLLGCR